jgi:predicted TIM-barrel fold metal-dependent hydrolase
MAPPGVIVDGHHHIGLKPGLGEFSADDLVEKMDIHGVTMAVVMHFVSPLRTPDDFERANAYIAEQVSQHPSRLVAAVAVDPRMGEAALDAIERYHRLGFRAVKLQPILHGNYAVDRGVVDDLAFLAGKLGLPIVIHSDSTSTACSPWTIAALARRFPQTTFVLLHMGLHPEQVSHVPTIVESVPNVVVDTSQTPDVPELVYTRAVQVLGRDRVVFGTDGPECDLTLSIRKLELALESGGLSLADAQAVIGGNADRIFSLGLADRLKLGGDNRNLAETRAGRQP